MRTFAVDYRASLVCKAQTDTRDGSAFQEKRQPSFLLRASISHCPDHGRRRVVECAVERLIRRGSQRCK